MLILEFFLWENDDIKAMRLIIRTVYDNVIFSYIMFEVWHFSFLFLMNHVANYDVQ